MHIAFQQSTIPTALEWQLSSWGLPESRPKGEDGRGKEKWEKKREDKEKEEERKVEHQCFNCPS